MITSLRSIVCLLMVGVPAAVPFGNHFKEDLLSSIVNSLLKGILQIELLLRYINSIKGQVASCAMFSVGQKFNAAVSSHDHVRARARLHIIYAYTLYMLTDSAIESITALKQCTPGPRSCTSMYMYIVYCVHLQL